MRLPSASASAAPDTPPRQWWRLREGLLLFGFVLLVAAGVVSVVVPELGRDPEAGRAGDAAAQGAPAPAK